MNKLLPLILTLSTLMALSSCSQLISGTTEDPIKENPGKRTLGTYINDEVIETKALVNISKASSGFENAHITVVSYNGVVLLVGQVAEESLRQLAATTVANLRDVRRVHNELTVAGTSGVLTRTNDGWITAKVKGQLIADKTTQGRRIKVVTENGAVYLMGLITKDEAERAAETARQVRGVQKVVRLFEYI